VQSIGLPGWRSPAYISRVTQTDQRAGAGEFPGGGRAWRTAAIVTAINALTSAGFSAAGLMATFGGTNPSARVFAMYAAARSLPLAAATLWLVYVRSIRELGAMAILLGVIQACDALVGLWQHDVSKTLGPAVFAVATFAAARALLPRAVSS